MSKHGSLIPNKWADLPIEVEPIQSESERGYQTTFCEYKKHWRELEDLRNTRDM
jgi:hypothetical protein